MKRMIIAGALLIIALAAVAAGSGILERSREGNTYSYSARDLSGWTPGEIPLPHGSIAVNTAGEDELSVLPLQKKELAAAIVAERENNGIFHYPEDLTVVKGIGTGTVRKLRNMINFDMEQEE